MSVGLHNTTLYAPGLVDINDMMTRIRLGSKSALGLSWDLTLDYADQDVTPPDITKQLFSAMGSSPGQSALAYQHANASPGTFTPSGPFANHALFGGKTGVVSSTQGNDFNIPGVSSLVTAKLNASITLTNKTKSGTNDALIYNVGINDTGLGLVTTPAYIVVEKRASFPSSPSSGYGLHVFLRDSSGGANLAWGNIGQGEFSNGAFTNASIAWIGPFDVRLKELSGNGVYAWCRLAFKNGTASADNADPVSWDVNITTTSLPDFFGSLESIIVSTSTRFMFPFKAA